MAQKEGPGAGEENDGLHRPLSLSEELSEVVGDGPMGRADVVSGLWDYIKKNDLQDAKNRRQINADANLRKIFGKDNVTMFEMTKLINNHVKKA